MKASPSIQRKICPWAQRTQAFRHPLSGPPRQAFSPGFARMASAVLVCSALTLGTARGTENGPILLAPSVEDLQTSPSAAPPSLPLGASSASSPGNVAIPDVSPPSPAPATTGGPGGWVRAGTGRNRESAASGATASSPPLVGSANPVPAMPQQGQPPGAFYGTARPLTGPAAANSTAWSNGVAPGASPTYGVYSGGIAQGGVGPYATTQPGPYPAPRQQPEKGWFGLPKLDLSKLDLGKLFRRKSPQNPAYAPVPAPASITTNTNAWRGVNTAGTSVGYPNGMQGDVIRQPQWNPQDPQRPSGNGTGNIIPPSGYGASVPASGVSTGSALATNPPWNSQNPYAAPYAVPPQTDSAWATTPQNLPLTASMPQGVGSRGTATLPSSGRATETMRIASPTPYAGPTGTLFGGAGATPVAPPEGGFIGKPTFLDRVKVWWKDVTTPRRDHPRAALLPPNQTWQNLQSRLQPRPQTPGRDPFTVQRGVSYPVDAGTPGAASTMQRSNYSPALLPPPRPQLPGSIPRW
ncbi:hypothetical protein [Thermopirellula anaerolimosa]